MAPFEFSFQKFGDPLLDPSQSIANCICLIDREHMKIIFALSDPKFPSLSEETRMIWLREFGTVSNALDQSFALPKSIEEINCAFIPPNQYSPSRDILVEIEKPLSRESVAWFARALWKLLEIDEISPDTRLLFIIGWKTFQNEEFKSRLMQFLKTPRIISQTQKHVDQSESANQTSEQPPSQLP